MESLKEAAIQYAKMGWAVHPLEARSKEPATKHGFKDARTNPRVIEKIWSDYPDCNVSIATGFASHGLLVIDLDVDPDKGEDGVEWLADWEAENGKLPETVCAVTGRGGSHLYFKTDKDIKCSTNPNIGVDIRCNGGYVMAPPSIHPNGNQVYWDLSPDDVDVAEANELVMKLVAEVSRGSVDDTPYEVKDKVVKGERDEQMYKFCCSMRAKCVARDVCLAAALEYNKNHFEPPMSVVDVKKKVASAYKNPEGTSGFKKKQEIVQKKDSAKSVAFGDIELAVNKNGSPLQTTENHIRVLVGDELLAGHFRYNEITYTRDVVLPVPWERGEGTRAIKDTDYINFSAYCEKYYGLMSKNKATDAILSVAEDNHYNPLREWLDSLKWDGIPRADTLFSMFLGAEPSDYNMAVSRLFLRGAVRRAYEPGAKFDYMPILVGRQGLGKSYFLRMLCGNSAYYCDNLNTIEGDAAIEKLRGMWIVELAELLATKRQKDVESLKAFTTSTVDTIRPKYARETEQRPRVCVFAGTTNSVHFLTDRTGNRRQLPVECGVHEPLMSLFEDGTAEYFAQAWAEVVAEYKADHPALLLPASVADFAEEVKESHMEDDPRVGIIQDYLEEIENSPSIDKRVCVAMVLENALHMDRDVYMGKMQVSREIGEILRHQIDGWSRLPKKQKLREWGSQWCYCPDALVQFNGKMWIQTAES